MTLGEIIKSYRIEHSLSMDKFSEMSGISKAYISLLEKNTHPKSGKPITPSVQTIKQASDAMHIDFNSLFEKIEGDVSVTPSDSEIDEDDFYNFYTLELAPCPKEQKISKRLTEYERRIIECYRSQTSVKDMIDLIMKGVEVEPIKEDLPVKKMECQIDLFDSNEKKD